MSIITEKVLVELNLLRTLAKMKDYNSSNIKTLKDKNLLDYHRKTHMLYNANLVRKPANKQYINELVDMHDFFVEEMERRGMKHTSPMKKL